MSESCIRVLADEEQIEQCKEDIKQAQTSFERLSKALNLAGNEVRLKMLYLLHKESQLCPCDISDILSMSIPAVSQHLRKLKDAGLVASKKTGQTIFYSITNEHSQVLDPVFNVLAKQNETT